MASALSSQLGLPELEAGVARYGDMRDQVLVELAKMHLSEYERLTGLLDNMVVLRRFQRGEHQAAS